MLGLYSSALVHTLPESIVWKLQSKACHFPAPEGKHQGQSKQQTTSRQQSYGRRKIDARAEPFLEQQAERAEPLQRAHIGLTPFASAALAAENAAGQRSSARPTSMAPWQRRYPMYRQSRLSYQDSLVSQPFNHTLLNRPTFVVGSLHAKNNDSKIYAVYINKTCRHCPLLRGPLWNVCR